ncbi:MAG: M15 family metallopeptidase, partial [Clostridiales bacterium]|nr:M15 family metallopeptidase [Clostridiales bacterium]
QMGGGLEDMTKNQKRSGKRWRKAALLLLVVLALLAAAVLYCKPGWRYRLLAGIAIYLEPGVELTEADGLDLEGYTLEELESDERVSFDQSLLLINSAHQITEDFTADIVCYGDTDVEMNLCVTEAYRLLAAEVLERFDEHLYIRSAYRTAEEQAETVEEDGDVAAPLNASEHQAGLALDVYVPYYAGMGFLDSEAGQYINANCWQFGFIIRYPSYGVEETGISYEPWHLRYVGAPHAEIITKNHLTLEGHLDALEPGVYYQYDGYLISRQEGETLLLPEGFSAAVISEDNMGGYVVTAERADNAA